MSDTDTVITDLITKLDVLATQYTPDVIDTVLAAVQITAASNLIGGTFALFFCYFLINSLKKQTAKYGDNIDLIDLDTGPFMSLIGKGMGITLSGLIAFFSLADLWQWVALWDPKLGLAHKILGL